MHNVRKRLEMTPVIPESAYVAPSAVVIGDVAVGDDASIWHNVTIRGDVEKIRIGDRSNVQDNSVIHVTKDTYPTILGTDVTIGHSVTLHGCTIGSNVLVGIGSVILDNVEVGDNCIIAANSLLTPGKKFPAGSMIMGSPAKAVRELTEAEIASVADYAVRYVGYKNVYIEMRADGVEPF